MQAAIENLALMKADRKVVILGDMFELEGEAAKEHHNIGKLLREKGFNEIYLCGNLFRTALEEIPFAMHFPTKAELRVHLEKDKFSNATILVKASRGIGLETIIDLLN
jgi:UDP-N-acetylmuramoyl-tripeptide--D-alanyl-D-alanine ligase